MAKTTKGPQPYYKKSHKCWYVKLPTAPGIREDVRLDPDENKAMILFYQKMAEQAQLVHNQGGNGPLNSSTVTVRQIITAFLQSEKLDPTVKEKTRSWHQRYLAGNKGFGSYISPTLKLSDLRNHHLTQMLNTNFEPDKVGARNSVVTCVKRALNWAVEEGYVNNNPLSHYKRPPKIGRGGMKEAYITNEEFRELISAIKDQQFRDYCTFMYETGCRAEEINGLLCSWCDLENDRIIIPGEFVKSQKLKKQKNDKSIFLNSKAKEIAKRNQSQHSEGQLFRNMAGTPWTADNVKNRFTRLYSSGKFRRQLTATYFRHTFITNALIREVSQQAIQKLVGHSSLKMISQIYSHVENNSEFMLDAVKQATNETKVAEDKD